MVPSLLATVENCCISPLVAMCHVTHYIPWMTLFEQRQCHQTHLLCSRSATFASIPMTGCVLAICSLTPCWPPSTLALILQGLSSLKHCTKRLPHIWLVSTFIKLLFKCHSQNAGTQHNPEHFNANQTQFVSAICCTWCLFLSECLNERVVHKLLLGIYSTTKVCKFIALHPRQDQKVIFCLSANFWS